MKNREKHVHVVATNTERSMVPHHPGWTSQCWQIFLRSSTTSRLFIPCIHHTIPFTILALIHDRTRIHRAEQHSPLPTTRIAAANPFVRLLCISGSATLFTLTIFVRLITMETANPNPEVFACTLIHGAFGRSCGIVLLFGSTASSAFRVVFVHGTVPFGGELACIDYSA